MLTTLKTPSVTKWTWSGAGYVRKSPGEKQLAALNRRQVYKRARYYDTNTGEFVSRDPLEYVDGMSQYRGYFAPGATDPTGTDVSKRDCKKWKESSCCLEYCRAKPKLLGNKGQYYQNTECQKCCNGTCPEKSCDEICDIYTGLTKFDDPFLDVDGIGGVLSYNGKLCPCLFSYPGVMGIKPGDCPALDQSVIEHEQNHADLDLKPAKTCRVFRRKPGKGKGGTPSECRESRKDIEKLRKLLAAETNPKCKTAMEWLLRKKIEYVADFCVGIE